MTDINSKARSQVRRPRFARPWYYWNIGTLGALLTVCIVLERMGVVDWQVAAVAGVISLLTWGVSGILIAVWNWYWLSLDSRWGNRLRAGLRSSLIGFVASTAVILLYVGICVLVYLPEYWARRNLQMQGGRLGFDTGQYAPGPKFYCPGGIAQYVFDTDIVRSPSSFSSGPTTSSEDLRVVTRWPHLTFVKLTGAELSDDDLSRILNTYPKLNGISIAGTKINGAGFRSLRAENRLKLVWLRNCPVNDEGLSHLAACKNLLRLDLSEIPIKGSRLGEVTGDPMLTLNIEKCPLESFAVEQLNQLPNLYNLQLKSCGIGGDALTRLQSQVRHLTLEGGEFNDDCIPALSKQPRLVSLHLANASVSGKGLSVLKDSPTLETLLVSSVPLTNDDVPFLAELTNLKSLYVYHSKITATAFEELSRQINAKIDHTWLPGENPRGYPGPP